MKYKGDIGLYLSGAPVPLPECALFITQPTIKQIMQFGETTFLTAAHLIGDTEKYLEDVRAGNPELAHKSDFQLLLTLLVEDTGMKKYMDTFFELVFPDYDIKYEKAAISFFLKDEESKNPSGMVTMYSFQKFQRTISELFIVSSESKEEYNPVNDTAKKIAEKLKKGREKTQSANGNEINSLYGSYASILSVGMHMDINIFFNYTPFQLMDSFKRYFEKEKCDYYKKLASTPMMDISKMDEPEDWTRNFYPA